MWIGRLKIYPLLNWWQTDPAFNLEFMKESYNKTLIPFLVIKTSWHKLSTILGHGGSSFYLQRFKKCSDWLSKSKKDTHTHPVRTHIDYLSKFLSAASSKPAAQMQAPQTSTAWKKPFPLTDDWTWSDKVGKSHITNVKSTVVAHLCMEDLKKNQILFFIFSLRFPLVEAISFLFEGFSKLMHRDIIIHLKKWKGTVTWDELHWLYLWETAHRPL